MNKFGIGVDADQYNEAPGHVLTSMVKRVDNAVFDVIARVKAGRFRGGISQFGLAEELHAAIEKHKDPNNGSSLVPVGFNKADRFSDCRTGGNHVVDKNEPLSFDAGTNDNSCLSMILCLFAIVVDLLND